MVLPLATAAISRATELPPQHLQIHPGATLTRRDPETVDQEPSHMHDCPLAAEHHFLLLTPHCLCWGKPFLTWDISKP